MPSIKWYSNSKYFHITWNKLLIDVTCSMTVGMNIENAVESWNGIKAP